MAKHEKIEVDFDKPYESNTVGLRGILFFGIGLFLLIVVTFGLMWFLLQVMEEDAVINKSSKNPLQLSKQEALPPEPRLQLAPGFGVDSPNGRANLELAPPQAEYLELQKQWKDLWENGQKDPQTGTIISLPIDEAKKKLLEQLGAADQNNGAKTLENSMTIYSDTSAGRMATGKIR